MPDCPCGGTNPNCFRCWGKGWYGDGATSVPPYWCKGTDYEHLATVTHYAPEIETKKLVKCQKCNSMVRADRLEKHIRKIHSSVSVSRNRPLNINKASSKGKKDCPCGGVNSTCFRCWGKGWYTPILANDNNSNIKNNKKITQNLENGEFSTCHICKSKLLKKNMQKHLRKIHGHNSDTQSIGSKIFKENQKNEGSVKKYAFVSDNKECIGHVKQNSNDHDNSDFREARFGGKNLAYLARENGRYGSLPLYDDYSEESDSD